MQEKKVGAGKGDKPRNCFSKNFKNNYESIDWKTSDKNYKQKELKSIKVKYIYKF